MSRDVLTLPLKVLFWMHATCTNLLLLVHFCPLPSTHYPVGTIAQQRLIKLIPYSLLRWVRGLNPRTVQTFVCMNIYLYGVWVYNVIYIIFTKKLYVFLILLSGSQSTSFSEYRYSIKQLSAYYDFHVCLLCYNERYFILL
jgi:hypothetical protein